MVETRRADVGILVPGRVVARVGASRDELGREAEDGQRGQERPQDHDAKVEERSRHQDDHARV